MNKSRQACVIRLLSIFLIFTSLQAEAQSGGSDQTCFALQDFSDGEVADADVMNCNFEIVDTRLDLLQAKDSNLQEGIDSLENKNIPTILWVANSGGDYNNLNDALAAIRAASSTNPYLINVGPGTFYTSSPITLKDHVYIKGSGVGTTTITCINASDCSSIFYVPDVTTRVSDLTVFTQGAGKMGVFILGQSGSSNCKVNLDNIRVEVQASGNGVSQGIYSQDCYDVAIRDTHTKVWVAGSSNTAVYLTNNTYVRVSDLRAEVSSASSINTAVFLQNNINAEYERVNAHASSSSSPSASANGLRVFNGSPHFKYSSFFASGSSSSNNAVYNSQAYLKFFNSVIETNSSDSNPRAIFQQNSTGYTNIFNSTANGALICNGALRELCFRCGGVYDSNGYELDRFCGPPS